MEPFFLPGVAGQRFCVYYPSRHSRAKGSVLVVPPFAEEMNKCRRTVALAARALQAAGCNVLVPDLFGTGDSAGDFGDARVALWHEDIVDAARWLVARDAGRMSIIAVRTGGLLLKALEDVPQLQLGRLVLWQPVTSGKVFVNQFLRLKLAEGLLATSDVQESSTRIRDELNRTGSLEVAGYRVSARLLSEVEGASLVDLPAVRFERIAYFEVGTADSEAVTPAAQRVVDSWQRAGWDVHKRTVAGEPFWSTVEIATSPGLVNATVNAIVECGVAAHA